MVGAAVVTQEGRPELPASLGAAKHTNGNGHLLTAEDAGQPREIGRAPLRGDERDATRFGREVKAERAPSGRGGQPASRTGRARLARHPRMSLHPARTRERRTAEAKRLECDAAPATLGRNRPPPTEVER